MKEETFYCHYCTYHETEWDWWNQHRSYCALARKPIQRKFTYDYPTKHDKAPEWCPKKEGESKHE